MNGHALVMDEWFMGKDYVIEAEWRIYAFSQWRQANIWTNAAILSIGNLETNFNELLIEIDI